MKNVASIFGKTARKYVPYTTVGWVLPDQLIGLEIEAENVKGVVPPVNVHPYWRQERDGSLRNGVEYVLAAPLKGDMLAKAIQDIFSGAVYKRTTTGSTHIHVDMLEEGVGQDVIKAMTLLVYALEPAVFAIADKGREWCGYTNKLCSGPDELVGAVLNSTDEDHSDLLMLCNNNYQTGRYYGANLLALAKYGSIEFRYFPTATSAEELTDWVQLVQSFKKAAQDVGGVAGVNRVFASEDAYSTFITEYFSRWKDKFLEEVPQYQALNALHKALGVASSYAHVRKNPPEPFNENAIMQNTVLMAKFANRKQRPIEPVQFYYDLSRVNPHYIMPNGEEVPVGTMMQNSGNIYISDGLAWRTMPSTRVDHLPVNIRRSIIKTIEHELEGGNFANQMRTNGFASDRVRRLLDDVEAQLRAGLAGQGQIQPALRANPAPRTRRVAPTINPVQTGVSSGNTLSWTPPAWIEAEAAQMEVTPASAQVNAARQRLTGDVWPGQESSGDVSFTTPVPPAEEERS